MPNVLALRYFLVIVPVWSLMLSCVVSAQSSRGVRFADAHSQTSQQDSIYRLISVVELSSAFASESAPLAFGSKALLQTLGGSVGDLQLTAVGSARSEVSHADFSTSDDVPEPIMLVDCGEASTLNITTQCSPIFESTISSRFENDAAFVGGAGGQQSGLRGGLQGEPGGGLQGRAHANGVQCDDGDCDVCNPCSPWYKVFRSFCSEPTCDEGIGRERIMFAPFDIEVPLPTNYYAIRYDNADGLRSPDRAEYFWAKQGGLGPPAGERSIDYQDLRFIMSLGGDRFSTITEVPLRFIDAAGNGGSGGLSNISIATKLLLIDGQRWKITQFFKTYLNTGSVKRGLANGHVSLEPGLLAQYQWSPTRYWFGELRYWFPMGADPSHGGNVLRYSLGTAKLWYETDTFAAIRTLEFVGTSVLSGQKTVPSGLFAVDVDSEHSMAILPGFRFVLGPAGDLGLVELGVQAGIATNKKGFYSSLGRVELRFNF